MGIKAQVEGYEAFKSKTAEMEKLDGTLVILFSGSKDPSTGKSWCPDCVTAEPIVTSALDEAMKENKNINYLYVAVGERNYWKSQDCHFRTDSKTKLKSIPTLIRWDNPSIRLDEDNCGKQEMVQMFFEEL